MVSVDILATGNSRERWRAAEDQEEPFWILISDDVINLTSQHFTRPQRDSVPILKGFTDVVKAYCS